jgi:hypothetical protein
MLARSVAGASGVGVAAGRLDGTQAASTARKMMLKVVRLINPVVV